MIQWGRPLIAAVILLLLSGPDPTPAAERCTVQIHPTTGDLAVSATDVAPNPRWGVTPDATTRPFADEGTCLAGDKLRKCGLGAAGTLAARTPPPLCTLCVADDGPAPACCVQHIKGCTPGIRIADASFPAGDPRLAAASGPIDAATLGGVPASDFALAADVPALSVSSLFAVSRHREAGTTSMTMTGTSQSVCFLTSVSVEETDSDNEWAQCVIDASAGSWVVTARAPLQ
jgi:hypothetical protein